MADVHAADDSPEQRRLPMTPDAHRRQSHDAAAESSSAGSSRSAAAPDLLTRESLLLHQSRLATEQTDGPARYDTTRRTKRRDRPSGSFLLDGGGVRRSHGSRLPKPAAAAPTARTGATTDSLSNTPESARSIALREKAMRVVSEPFAGKLLTPSPEATHNLSTGSLSQPSPASSRNSHAAPSVDADSTQIVTMALNLSESRRLASRRNVSRAAPPKLLPLPDSATSNDLRLQLKQQRRSSRNISPRPGQSMIPRQGTGLSVSSPLLSSFPLGQDDMYRYHFSASTLARAQKAKDQLELMAQYRRLLDVLPPLKPAHLRLAATSPPASPVGGAKAFAWTSNAVQLGRKYNPLQYIRNRKVRARERRVIDGERQGFGDVDMVKSWVERCEQNVALQQPDDEAEHMVPFSSADNPASQSIPDPVAKAARNRRPRVDWFIEPCDMIADAYWLEQHRNKELIEDRHWRRIFPPNSELSRPMSREGEDGRHVMPFNPETIGRVPKLSDMHRTHRNHGAEHGRQPVIDRAREKLSHIRDPNHWLVSDHLYARPGSKKDSASEYSESDNEARNRTVRDTRRRAENKDAQPGDILHKQMLEMFARENKGKDISELAGIEHFVPPSMASPERNLHSKSSSRLQSRRESFLETSDHEHKGTFERMHKASPHLRPEDQVVDESHLRAPRSIDNDSSLPTSPELRPSRKATLESVSLELPAPWSRSGSPSRHDAAKNHPISEAKRGADSQLISGSRADTLPRGAIGYALPLEGEPSLLRNSSAPVAGETAKSNRRMGSLLQRADDPNSGLRGIFKGPRIDTVLRGGVSRIGDILRKKDGSGESQELDSTDESDSDHTGGRRRASMSLSRRTSKKDQLKKQTSKHFLDVMPQFQHASGSSADNSIHKSTSWTAHGVQSSESSRVDLLKPPQAEAGSQSMSTSPPPNATPRPVESDISETDSTKGRVPPGVRETDRRLNAILGDPVSRRVDRSERAKSRQWSIADQGARQIEQSQLSRREMARVKTLVLSSGIKAMEISRRSQETHKPLRKDGTNSNGRLVNIDWDGIAKLCPESKGLDEQAVPLAEEYSLAAQTLTANVQLFGQRWQASADRFTTHTGPELHRRVGAVRSRIADDLAPLTRLAVEEADEASRGLALDQPLRIKHVVDTIEKMLRRRRRRLRWLRRGLWLSVEWLVVGFMWYVWFVVMILRVFLGIGKCLWGGVKWLLWLA